MERREGVPPRITRPALQPIAPRPRPSPAAQVLRNRTYLGIPISQTPPISIRAPIPIPTSAAPVPVQIQVPVHITAPVIVQSNLPPVLTGVLVPAQPKLPPPAPPAAEKIVAEVFKINQDASTSRQAPPWPSIHPTTEELERMRLIHIENERKARAEAAETLKRRLEATKDLPEEEANWTIKVLEDESKRVKKQKLSNANDNDNAGLHTLAQVSAELAANPDQDEVDIVTPHTYDRNSNLLKSLGFKNSKFQKFKDGKLKKMCEWTALDFKMMQEVLQSTKLGKYLEYPTKPKLFDDMDALDAEFQGKYKWIRITFPLQAVFFGSFELETSKEDAYLSFVLDAKEPRIEITIGKNVNTVISMVHINEIMIFPSQIVGFPACFLLSGENFTKRVKKLSKRYKSPKEKDQNEYQNKFLISVNIIPAECTLTIQKNNNEKEKSIPISRMTGIDLVQTNFQLALISHPALLRKDITIGTIEDDEFWEINRQMRVVWLKFVQENALPKWVPKTQDDAVAEPKCNFIELDNDNIVAHQLNPPNHRYRPLERVLNPVFDPKRPYAAGIALSIEQNPTIVGEKIGENKKIEKKVEKKPELILESESEPDSDSDLEGKNCDGSGPSTSSAPVRRQIPARSDVSEFVMDGMTEDDELQAVLRLSQESFRSEQKVEPKKVQQFNEKINKLLYKKHDFFVLQQKNEEKMECATEQEFRRLSAQNRELGKKIASVDEELNRVKRQRNEYTNRNGFF